VMAVLVLAVLAVVLILPDRRHHRCSGQPDFQLRSINDMKETAWRSCTTGDRQVQVQV